MNTGTLRSLFASSAYNHGGIATLDASLWMPARCLRRSAAGSRRTPYPLALHAARTLRTNQERQHAMSQDLWQRAEGLFHAALERSPQSRERFLDEACGDDPELRKLVESLVSKDEGVDGFLERPAHAFAPKATADPESLIGRQYGPYRIVALLGAGGMGEVYRAQDGRLGRDVAIKTLPHEFARDPRRLARFRREARMLASLNHPNIGAIYGLEESPDGDFLVLEIVEGEPLHGPQPLAAALALAAQVADALHAAHEHGIVHRDLKPANVKVTPQGLVKVLDFGLAKAIWSAESSANPPRPPPAGPDSTVAGRILGTPGYMSPEQARGEAVDERTDIWAFGCLLYELLTGTRAFTAASAADAIEAVLERDPDWQALPADVPGEVRGLLRRCLQKEMDSRPRTIADARATLRRAEDGTRSSRPVPPATQAVASLAVLPFANVGGDPDSEFLSDGIADDLLAALSRVPELRVPGRTSCFAFKGKSEDLRRIGQALGVETVLEGSVRRDGSRLRITAQLINVADGFHLWSERYDREMADVFGVQDEITHAITAALLPKLAAERPATLVKPYTGSVDVYELCLRARYHHQQRTAEGLATALRLFEQAIARDPNCAMAYAGISHVLLVICYFGGLPTKVGMPRMKAAALRALELDDTLAVAHVRLADALFFKDWDWAGAEREFRRALELDPDSTEALWRYGFFLWARGRHPEALVQLQKGLALDRFSLDTNYIPGWVHLSLRQLDEAEDVAKRMLAMDPNVWLGYHVRGVARLLKGDDAAALGDFEKMAEIEGGPAMHSILCWCYARLGRMADARRTLERIEQMMAHRHAPPGWLVWAYHGLGDTARARAYFEQAVEERHMMMVHFRGYAETVGDFKDFENRLNELGL